MRGGYPWHEPLFEASMRAVVHDTMLDMYAMYELVSPRTVYLDGFQAGEIMSLLACPLSKTETELLLDNLELSGGRDNFRLADSILTSRNINIYTMHRGATSPTKYSGSACIDCQLDVSSHITEPTTDWVSASNAISQLSEGLAGSYRDKYPQFCFDKEES